MSTLPAIFERAGLPNAAAAAQVAGEVLDTVCDMRPGKGGKTTTTMTTTTSTDTDVGRNPRWPAGWCKPPYYEKIVEAYNEACGQIPDCGYVDAIQEVIDQTSFAQVEDSLGTISLLFEPTGMVGTGFASNGKTPTTFVADFPVGSGESILLEQDPTFDLPWRPMCMDLDLTFDGGTQVENYAKIRVKVWVNDKTFVFNSTNTPVGTFGVPWNRKKIYRGKEFYCGDSCNNVPVQGRSGCAGIDQVGRESRLLIQIDNIGNTNDIDGGTVEIGFAGFEKPCCDACSVGKGCSCGH